MSLMSNVLQRLTLTFDSTYTITLETKFLLFQKVVQQQNGFFFFSGKRT
jgi:hypothetical protein